MTLFALLLGCSPADPTPLDATAKGYTAQDLIPWAVDARSLCNGGQWCIYGAMSPDTNYDPVGANGSLNQFVPMLGTVLEFAVSFNATATDEFISHEGLYQTWYDMELVDVVMLGTPGSFVDLMAVDLGKGVGYGSIHYDWYTSEASLALPILVGDDYGFQVYDPSGADAVGFTPNQMIDDYGELQQGRGDGIGVLRAYDPVDPIAMTDFATGPLFYFVEPQ